MRNSYYEEYRLHLPFSRVRELLFPYFKEIIDELDDDEFSRSSDPAVPEILQVEDADLNCNC